MIVTEVKSGREALGISQSKLARLANVSRFKISVYEVGGGSLSVDEFSRIKVALRDEAQRLRLLSDAFVGDAAPAGATIGGAAA